MPYTDHYERDVYGIIAFWIRDHLEHGSFFDREISHYELEIARENQGAMGRFNSILAKADSKSVDVGNLLEASRRETRIGGIYSSIPWISTCSVNLSFPRLIC